MAVHRSGALAPVAGDLQTTHQGVQIALKMVDWGSGQPFLALLEKVGSAWQIVGLPIYEFADDHTGVGGYAFVIEAAKLGVGNVGVAAWVKKVLVPLINAKLAVRFKPTSTPPAPPPAQPADPIDNLDSVMIGMLKWAPQADGTLQVTA